MAFAWPPMIASLPLILDPVLVYSTYLGGSGTFAQSIAVDGAGSAYVTGTPGGSFPTNAGAAQTTPGGSQDAFVTKLNSTGSALVYSTYLGGSDNDIGNGIAVDGAGNAYVTGYTQFPDFPTTSGAAQTTFGGDLDAFVTKLDVTGSRLDYSTHLGGGGFDFGFNIVVDGAGSAYVTGYTRPTNFPSTEFPTTAGAHQPTNAGEFDAFVTKLDASGSMLVYSTYLGGSDTETGQDIAVDGTGNAYVTGITDSTDFPTTAGAVQSTHAGGVNDVFVTKLNATGSGLVYSTYLGGSDSDLGYGIAVDGAGSAHVTGHTLSTDFPTTAGAVQTTSAGGFGDAFVTKLGATGIRLVFSTYLGGSGSAGDAGFDIALDAGGSAYVTGYTTSADFPTTAGAFQATHAGGDFDAFVTKLGVTGAGLVFSTYLGGSAFERAFGIAVDGAGSAYVTGSTRSTNFPTTAGAFQTTHSGSEVEDEAFIAKIATLPTSVDECKNGGWKTFGVFKNQGDCVSFVASKGKNPPSGS